VTTDLSGAQRARVLVRSLPTDGKPRRAATLAIASALGVPVAHARDLLAELPVILPRQLPLAEATSLASTIKAGGGLAEIDVRAARTAARCDGHPTLDSQDACEQCARLVCAVCTRRAGGARICPVCLSKARRRRAFRRIRIAVLLAILALVLAYAWRDVRGRKLRTQWTAPVDVALVLLRTDRLEPGTLELVTDALPALEARLADELARYRSGSMKPFRFTAFGPVDLETRPPKPGEGFLETLSYSYELFFYLRRIDKSVELSRGKFDSTIYLVTRRPRGDRSFIEGTSQQGGRVGIVEVDLDHGMAPFALFVATHELLHTLGATDKYDASGRALVPDGLGEPDRVPLYPQRYAEVMARNVVLAPGRERPPKTLDEIRIGALTAREIGWTTAAPP
jgi:hypothetical protein